MTVFFLVSVAAEKKDVHLFEMASTFYGIKNVEVEENMPVNFT